MAQGMTTKTLKDGTGATFTGQFYDDGSGNIYPVQTAANMLSNPAKYSMTGSATVIPYSTGDLIANNATAGSVVPLSWTGATMGGLGGTGVIDGVQINKSSANAALVRVHFFTATQAVTNGDNGAILFTSFNLDTYIGFIDVTVSDVGSGGMVGQTNNAGLAYSLTAADTIYALMEATAGFTQVSAETWTVRPKFKRFG